MNSIKIEKPNFGKPNWNVKGPNVDCFADIRDYDYSVFTFKEFPEWHILAQNQADAEVFLARELETEEGRKRQLKLETCPGCGAEDGKCEACPGCDEYECECSCEDDED